MMARVAPSDDPPVRSRPTPRLAGSSVCSPRRPQAWRRAQHFAWSANAGGGREDAVLTPWTFRRAQSSSPLVSVVTPVFNGAQYLRPCIESVLAQSYDNWDYTIVDNCSTDGSLAIAHEYAEKHPRLTVQSNTQFVGVIENHNRAFRSISPEAKYCKVVSADDWIYPECISRLVELGERHPSVGIIGSYWRTATGVRWSGLPLEQEVLAGREAARRCLLGTIDSFWTPSAILYRASMFRDRDPFFPGSATSADVAACLDCLDESDLGFVHQVLSFERIHDDMITAQTTNALKMNSMVLDRVRLLAEFGPRYLSVSEHERALEEQLSYYFALLADEFFHIRNRQFWKLHEERLNELGHSIRDRRFAKAIAAKLVELAANPKTTTEKVVRRVKGRRHGVRLR
jgi:glycosyltransferase involved in cell wall biosynthesis